MLSLILWAAAGAGLGVGAGGLTRGTLGRIPWAFNRRASAAAGALLGAALYFVAGQNVAESMNQSSPEVKRIRADQFAAEVSASAQPVMVDFYATWCGPCRRLAPRVDRLAQQFSNQVKFVKINLDEAADLAQRYQIEAIPTLLFFRDGKLQERLVGLPSDEALETELKNLAGTGG